MTGVGVGRNSFSIIISDDGQLVYSPRKDGELVMHTDESYNIRQTENEQLLQLVEDAQFKLGSFGEAEIDGEKYFAAYADMPTVDWVQFTFIPLSEMDRPTVALLTEVDAISTDAERLFKNAFRHSLILILGIALLLLANAFITSMSLSGKILKPINVMKRRIEAVMDDQFVFQMEDIYRTGDEIEVLAKTFVHLSDQREDYLHRILTMTADQERVRTELSIASHIQTNMLPSVFPPFPERHEFDLFASMHPAKEVGGDFYDFLMVDDNHLAMVIADVSDKGVPAALFMTSAKILINYRAQLGGSPAEILKAANDQLCQNNEDMMFVTVWLGILELSTGKMICSNAGHKYPIMRGPDGTFRVIKDKHGMPLGIMSQSVFQDYELQMMPGSAVFVYTDGVPEAKNAEGTFYGMQRLQDTLNHLSGAKPEEILDDVKTNVQTFVGNARQFDDMTMLCLEYHGKSES
ncbi:MAG: SpoIIE family protein phosphatase [Clostridia bacterium]|nr:SpoIIE family protein phosphatase [Clostridia bacterium]